MTVIVRGVVLLAAILFIAVSASMNAVFLSSFGRTPTETTLLTGVSLAGDAIKAVLPIILMRAVMLRAWTHVAMAGVMLVVVIAMSLMSGLGFAALTRGNAVTARDGDKQTLAARLTDLVGIERQVAALGEARSATRIETDLDAAKLDALWTSSKACTQASGPATRQFCGGVFRLRSELAVATERDGLLAQKHRLRGEVERLRGIGALTDSDPQATALAEILGTDRRTPRMVLTTAGAVMLELGSILLILLAAGPTVSKWREPGTEPLAPPKVPTVPMSPDRAHWNRQRDAATVSQYRSPGDAR